MKNNMKKNILLTALLTLLPLAQAQESLPREEALKFAFAAGADLKQLTGTPIPTDPDLKYPVVVREGEYGGMILPECKLSETLAKAGKEIVPVGQFWLHKLAPLVEGRVVSESKLRSLYVTTPEGSTTVVVVTLGVRKTDSGSLELVGLGKTKEPILTASMKAVTATQELPIQFTGERESDGATITLTFLGKYQASFKVTDPEQF